MGDATLINQMDIAPEVKRRRPNSLVGDVPLAAAVASLILLGLLIVYSASWNYSIRKFDSSSYLIKWQLVWVSTGLLLSAILNRIPYQLYRRLAVPIMVGTLASLLIVLVVNDSPEGYARTLLGGSIQPSELAKLAIVIYLSVWLNSRREEMSTITLGLIPLMLIMGITAGLIVIQPDLSAAATVIFLACLMFYLAGAEVKQVILLGVVVILLGTLVVAISSTGQERIGYYFSGLQDPSSAHYQVKRGLESVVRGGIFGVGIGKGVTKFTGLPVPWTDSVFAVIAEELGLLGAMVFIALYLVILWRGIAIACMAPDLQGRMLAAGITIWITLEAMINISVMINLLPYAGNALPLVSYGGSITTTTLAGIGILTNVARQGHAEPEGLDRRFFSAIVDLRGRNRRRSVSGSGRPRRHQR